MSPFRNPDGSIRIPERASSSSDPALADYEEKIKCVADDQALADSIYDQRPDSKGGKVIGTDIARELLEEFRTREGKIRFTNATGRVGQAYAKDRLWREIHCPDGRERLMFTAGGVAAGKSTVVTDEAVALHDLVFDGTLREAKWAIEAIEQALANGWEVEINYIQRPIELAIRGAIERAHRTGRWGPLVDLPSIHQQAQRSIIEIAHHFSGNDRVQIYYWLNDGTVEQPKAATSLTLKDIDRGGAHSYGENHDSGGTKRLAPQKRSSDAEGLSRSWEVSVAAIYQASIESQNFDAQVLRLLAQDSDELQGLFDKITGLGLID